MRGDGITIKSINEGKQLIRWRDEHGCCRQKYLYCTFAEAEQIKDEALAKSGRTRRVGGTFETLVGPYKEWAQRQKAYKDKEYVIDALAKEFDKVALYQINTQLVEKYQSKVLKDRAPATANRHIATLKHMFTKAHDWNMIDDATLKGVRKVKLLKENNSRLRYLSEEEIERLLDACRKSKGAEYLYPMVQIALNTGMRKGEIDALRWNMIDLVNGYILITDAMAKTGTRREVPINATLKAVLTAMPQRIDGTLFGGFSGKGAWEYAVIRAKLVDFHFHDLRHTFASRLVMAGVDLRTVGELLGHKTIAMTMRYSHLSPGHKKNAVTLLDKQCVNVLEKSEVKL